MTAEKPLKATWVEFKAENPKVRIRDAAKQMGVSEEQLLATNCGLNVTRLTNNFEAILEEVPTLGYVMALTRNDACVHERKGIYPTPEFTPHVGLVASEDIDLRLFMGNWNAAYAVTDEIRGEVRYSLHFFNKQGDAVHKIYLENTDSIAAFEAMQTKFKSDNQSEELTVEPAKAPRGEMPDAMIDAAGLNKDWSELKDTHDFYMLLGKYRITRTHALRLANAVFVKQVTNDTVKKMLHAASASQLPIMCFAGNAQCLQIHTGTVTKIFPMENWINVMDEKFNLHLDESLIANTFVVRKPTTDGVVTAIEVYDAAGEQIVQFFGKRKPGIPELQEWRSLVAELEA